MKTIIIIIIICNISLVMLSQEINVIGNLKNKAYEHYMNDNYSEALLLYEKIYAKDSLDLQTSFRYSVCLKEVEQYNYSTRLFKTLISKNYRVVACYINLSTIAVMQDDYYLANNYLIEAKRRFPNDKRVDDALYTLSIIANGL